MIRFELALMVTFVAAAVAHADEEASARAAVGRARAALARIDGAELARDAQLAPARDGFVLALDDARAAVELLQSGAARDECGHALNRLAIDALYARVRLTQGLLGRHVDLLHVDDACARLDRSALGGEAAAVENAVRLTYAAWRLPVPAYTRLGSDERAYGSLHETFDAAEESLRALLPRQRRYAQLLATRLNARLREWRPITLVVSDGPLRRGDPRPLTTLGALIDKAYVDARTPPFLTQQSPALQLHAARARGRVGVDVTVHDLRVGGAPGRLTVELMDDAGELLARRRVAFASRNQFIMCDAYGPPAGELVVLATLLCADGTLHTTAVRVAAAPERVGLVDALERGR
jgi:hypothetical protein